MGFNILKYNFHKGTVKGGRSENQDSVFISDCKHGMLALICDGMGGGKGGDIASETAVEVISDSIVNGVEGSIVGLVRDAIRKANFEVYNMGLNNEDLFGMGTTLALLLLTPAMTILAHVGDSRIYHLRNNKIIYRTDDHSRIFELMKQGVIRNEEEARIHPIRNQITRALGMAYEVMPDMIELDRNIDDYFYLCSDGINMWLSDKDIEKIHGIYISPRLIVDNSIAMANSLGEANGGNHDNISAISIHCI